MKNPSVFDTIAKQSISHRIGIRKSDCRIHILVLDKGSYSPSQHLFVDDKPAKLDSAAKMGIAVIA